MKVIAVFVLALVTLACLRQLIAADKAMTAKALECPMVLAKGGVGTATDKSMVAHSSRAGAT